MKKSTKKIILSIAISIITLIVGVVITAISFNIFDELTRNQLRLLFTFDVLILLAIGTISWFVYENKQMKNKKRKELERRHNVRVEKQTEEILNLINCKNFAA